MELQYTVSYPPAESGTGMFGGNSNWRGPAWFPVNVMLIRVLLNLYAFYGDECTVEHLTSGWQQNLYQVAREIAGRLVSIFTRGSDGRRPVHGGQPTLLPLLFRRPLARRITARAAGRAEAT